MKTLDRLRAWLARPLLADLERRHGIKVAVECEKVRLESQQATYESGFAYGECVGRARLMCELQEMVEHRRDTQIQPADLDLAKKTGLH